MQRESHHHRQATLPDRLQRQPGLAAVLEVSAIMKSTPTATAHPACSSNIARAVR
jgi:hypothetical protein